MDFKPINRNVLIISPTQKLLDWVNSLEQEAEYMDIDRDAHDESNVYLIKESDDIESALKWLHKNFKDIFAEELFNWWTDEGDWPALNWENFEAFCHYRLHTSVYDTQKGGIHYDY